MDTAITACDLRHDVPIAATFVGWLRELFEFRVGNAVGNATGGLLGEQPDALRRNAASMASSGRPRLATGR